MAEMRQERTRLAKHSPRETLGGAVADLLKALLAAPVRRIPPRASERLIALCALVALICPLLLWISWSKTGFVVIIGTATVAVGIIYLLIWVHPDDPF